MSGTRVLLLTLLTAAALLSWQGPALAEPSAESGYDPTAAIGAGLRLRSFNNGEGGEIYLGRVEAIEDRLDFVSEDYVEVDFSGGVACDGSTPLGEWQESNRVRFSYDPASGKIRIEVQASHAYCLEYTTGNLGRLNYLQIEVIRRRPGTTVEFRNVVLNGDALGDFVGSAYKTWQVTGLDLSDGFVLEGDLILAGIQPPAEFNMLQVFAGRVGALDDEAPIIRSVTVSPDPALVNGVATVTAVLDDTTTGGSRIATALYSLNGADWMPMASSDSEFDAPQEQVTATFPVGKVGVNTLCVQATDASGNTGKPTCATFVVGYDFDGFFWTIDDDSVNRARAGRVIPTLWRLTDASGLPIRHPGSFAGLYSYKVDCQTLAGDPTEAAEEHSIRHWGLLYWGHGYWQFNWKTPKEYRGSCRAMFVEFDSTQTSPVVIFRFR